jgi:glutaredoxin 3
VITVYSKNNCPFCQQAKNLLTRKGVQFEEVNIDLDAEAKRFIIGEGHRTVPQIYQDGRVLVEGGFQGLRDQPDEFYQTLKG